jgi:hypothetical protein
LPDSNVTERGNGDERECLLVLRRRENGFVEGDERFSGSIVVRSLWFG